MSDESEKHPAGDTDESPRRIKQENRYRVSSTYSSSPSPKSEASEADFEFWVRMATWTIEEAVSLSFECDPEQVSWASLETHSDVLFVKRLRQVRKLADRATAAGVLTNPCQPIEFVRWTHQNRIPFSTALAATLTSHIDESMRRQSEKTREKPSGDMGNEFSANLKSMKSLLKLVGGLAVAIYKYDPSAKKSDVPATIQSDLDLVGVSLDVDTIRKYLRLGVESAEIQFA